ncbi:MAG TPA: prepilin-type N-terminal cleavage/methylation domain-containing protein [Candidatus Acidoferrum sp.]|jgi:type II secretory pathway pseudopilin PulG|nr:prepilin-type N-terminal cleavage/methylation domain-containing protein [Candidatus Acidoferrum sp.]
MRQTPSSPRLRDNSSSGFSLIELMVSTVIFTLVVGMVFLILAMSQKSYNSEKELMTAFQQANIAMDQVTRDIHTTGYPPFNSFNTSVATANPTKVALPFAWSPSYPATPCTVGVTCAVPGDYDMILEEDLGNGVQWIRYSLQGTTLMRGMTPKVAGVDPATTTAPVLISYLDNVMNNGSLAQMTAIRQAYPSMFPGNTPVPVFTYTYATGTPAQPSNISAVNVTLIVQSPYLDQQTRTVRVAVLTGQAAVFNPNQ